MPLAGVNSAASTRRVSSPLRRTMPMADGLCAVAMAAMVSMTVFLAFFLILPKVYHKDEKMKRGAAAPPH